VEQRILEDAAFNKCKNKTKAQKEKKHFTGYYSNWWEITCSNIQQTFQVAKYE
jgi:hypothetical protein